MGLGKYLKKRRIPRAEGLPLVFTGPGLLVGTRSGLGFDWRDLPSFVKPGYGQNGPTSIDLDTAIQLALIHNHSLKATRTQVQQNEAQEITANISPTRRLRQTASSSHFSARRIFPATNVDQVQQFDVRFSYLFERGHKRQRRLEGGTGCNRRHSRPDRGRRTDIDI